MNIDGHGFNQEWAKKKTKAEFVSEFVDMEHIYPELKKADKPAALEAAWKMMRNEPDETLVVTETESTPIVEKKDKPGK